MDLVCEADLDVGLVCEAGLDVDPVCEAGLLFVMLFSEFFLDLLAEGVVGLDVARLWVR